MSRPYPRPVHEPEADLARERGRGWSGYVVVALATMAFCWILVPALVAIVEGKLP